MIDNIIKLKQISDSRGHMVILEEGKDIPFTIRRSYFIYGTTATEPRGFHAHKKLEQVFLCIKGSCDLLLDDGTTKSSLHMNEASTAVYVGPMVWHEMHNFTPDCIFMAYASDKYDEDDYIRDYTHFIEAC